MGWQPTDVIAPLVVVYGSKGGVFIYHGTPALGNPPIFWASNEGLKDPFGNTLPSIVGIAGSAVFTAGNTQTSTSGTVTYSAAPAANVMLSSDAPAAFTDSFGNAVLAGFAAYGKSGITYYAV